MQGVLECPKCGEAMYFKEPGFWKCPLCAGEFWEEDEPEEVQIRECYLEDMYRGNITVSLKKRGRGRRRTSSRKPLFTERYALI